MAKETKEPTGFKSTAEPFYVPTRKYVTLIFNPSDSDSDMLKNKIRQIANKYGRLKAILFHQLPSRTQCIEQNLDRTMIDFLSECFHTCISCYPTPGYLGDADNLIADDSKSADVYVLGDVTIAMERTIASMTNREIKMVFIPLADTTIVSFKMLFPKELSDKHRAEISNKISDLLNRNNIYHILQHSPLAIEGKANSFDDVNSPEQIHEIIGDFIKAEKLTCNLSADYTATPESEKARYEKKEPEKENAK